MKLLSKFLKEAGFTNEVEFTRTKEVEHETYILPLYK